MLEELFHIVLRAYAIFPEWRAVTYPLFFFLISFLLPRLLCFFLQRFSRSTPGDFWVERARRTYPARMVAGSAAIYFLIITLMFGGVADHTWRGSLLTIACAIASYAGSNLNLYYIQRWMRIPFRDWRTEVLSRLVYCIYFIATFLLITWTIGWSSTFLGSTLWGTITGFFVVVVIIRTPAYLLLLRMFGLLGQPSEKLRNTAHEAAREMNLTFQPRVYEMRSPIANAFAFHRGNSIVVTDTALGLMNEQELKSICHHEFAHLTESRNQRALRLLPLFGYFVFLGSWPILFPSAQGTLWFIPALAAAILVMRFFSSKISRRLEERADSAAAAAFKSDDPTYAIALEKLYQKNLAPVVIGRGFLSHPDLYDRMQKASVTPAYPRPAPPPRLGSSIALAIVVVLGAILAVIPFVIELQAARPSRVASSYQRSPIDDKQMKKLRRKYRWPVHSKRT